MKKCSNTFFKLISFKFSFSLLMSTRSPWFNKVENVVEWYFFEYFFQPHVCIKSVYSRDSAINSQTVLNLPIICHKNNFIRKNAKLHENFGPARVLCTEEEFDAVCQDRICMGITALTSSKRNFPWVTKSLCKSKF